MAEFVKPKVYKIASTKLEDDGVNAWLEDLGGESCLAHIEGDGAEKLIELCGRRCYNSFNENLNPNVTRIRKDSDQYHQNIKLQRHGSVTEHGSVTFAFENITRVLTHELVRHRVGAAYSQESLRYVRLTNLSMFFPSVLKKFGKDKEERAKKLMMDAMRNAENIQKSFMELFSEEMQNDFSTKKLLTSAFRRAVPMGVATGIVCTFNFRTLRHILEMRTSEHAEEEIRNVIGQMGEILVRDYPLIFGDYLRKDSGDGLVEFCTDNLKI